MQNESTRTTLTRMIDSWAERHRPESMNTDWGQALLAYGMARGLRTVSSDGGRSYLESWLTYHLGAGLPLTYFVGSWGIGLLFPELPEEFPHLRHELNDLARRLERMIRVTAIRNGEGILLHNVDLPHVYIDTIYYAAPVVAKVSSTIGADAWQNFAMEQLRGHLSLLSDHDSPFTIHCQQNLTGLRSEGAWGRGIGWVAMTCAELLDLLDHDSEDYREVSGTLTTLLTNLLPLQTENGLWRTLVDDATSYEETSASSMFLFALLVAERHHLLADVEGGAEGLDHGLAGVCSMVDREGRLLGCSVGTWPGDREYYWGLETGEWWWGTGAALLALAEAVDSGR